MSVLGWAGLGLSAVGTVGNAIAQARAARKRERALTKREADNEAWYNRRYNEVGTERATAQAALSAMRDAQKARMQRSAGASAVSNASSESVAAEKAAGNKAIGDTVSTITAQDDARKDKIENQYRTEKSSIEAQRQNIQAQKAQNLSTATGQLLNTAGTMIAASAVSSDSTKTKKADATNASTTANGSEFTQSYINNHFGYKTPEEQLSNILSKSYNYTWNKD